MTYKQFNKVTIGDKLSMFDDGTLQAKYKMNVVVRLRETPENIKRNRRYAVVNLIEQNNTMYINSDFAKYFKYEDDATEYLRTLNGHFYGL